MNGRQVDDDNGDIVTFVLVVGTWKWVLLGDSEDIAFAIGGQVSSIVKFAGPTYKRPSSHKDESATFMQSLTETIPAS